MGRALATLSVALLLRATAMASVSFLVASQTACRVYSWHVVRRLQPSGCCAWNFMATHPPTNGLPAKICTVRTDRAHSNFFMVDKWPESGPGNHYPSTYAWALLWCMVPFDFDIKALARLALAVFKYITI